jgi:hypothetical protein
MATETAARFVDPSTASAWPLLRAAGKFVTSPCAKRGDAGETAAMDERECRSKLFGRARVAALVDTRRLVQTSGAGL